MSRAGDRVVEVELVEDDPDGPDEPGSAGPSRAARLPRRVRWGFAVGAVVVLGAATVTQQLQSAALDARLEGVQGLSVSLDGPLTEAWRVPGDGVVGVVDGTVVAHAPGGTGTVGVDAASGAIRWAHTDTCELVPVGDGTAPPGAGRFVDRPDDLAVCVERSSAGGPGSGAVGAPVPSLAAHVLDPVTGEVQRCLDLGPAGSVATVGSDLLTVGIAADAHAEAARWSVVTGERRWSYRSANVMPSSEGWGSTIDGSVVQIHIGPWSLTLDADTGERIPSRQPRALAPRDVEGAVTLPDGAIATSRFSVSGAPTTTVRAPDGSDRARFPGLLAAPTVDDGSAGDLVLVVRGTGRGRPPGIVAVDPATGDTAWESPAPVGSVAVVRGMLLVEGDHGLSAHDVRTGALRWEAPGAGQSGVGMVTDGRRVLTAEAGPDGAVLTARDVVSGGPAWSSPLDAANPTLAILPDGTVVSSGSGAILALRP